MFIASIITKDKMMGMDIAAEDTDTIIMECLKWQLENELPACQVESSQVLDRDTGIIIGDVRFENTGVVFSPNTSILN